MKTTFIAFALCSALALSGCGGDDGAGDTGKTGVIERVFADPLTDAQIKKALLTVDDLPSGWTASPDEDEEDDDSDAETDSASAECKKLMDAMEGDDSTKAFGKGEAEFQGGEWGPFLSQSVSSMKGDEIEKSMDSFRDAFQACDSFTQTDDEGVKTEFKIADMSFPDLGDDTIALKMSAEAMGIPVDIPLVVVRVDQNVILLASVGLGEGMSSADLEKVARTAVTKVKAAS